MEAGGLEGAASTFTSDKLILNGAGEFASGGTRGRQRAFGKKARYRPLRAGDSDRRKEPLSGNYPHKVDKCSALRARQLAKKLVRDGGVDEARLMLGWAPGGDAPFRHRGVDKPGECKSAVAEGGVAAGRMVQYRGDRPRSGS